MSKLAMPQPAEPDKGRALKYVADAIPSIRYGSVVVVIYNGQVVQVETRHKRRFDSP
jgi:hypothetical protein